MRQKPVCLGLLVLSILVTAVGPSPVVAQGAPSGEDPLPGLDACQVIELPSPGDHQDIRPGLQAALDAAAPGDTILLRPPSD